MSEKKKREKNVHDRHRERLREQFDKHGLERFADHQALELLLTYAIPRGDVNPTAHELMRHFHSLSGVLEASPEDLMEVDGIGPKSALFIRFMIEFFRRYDCDRKQTSKHLKSTDIACKYIEPLFLGVNHEIVYLFCLDAQLKILHSEKMAEGSINSTNFNTRRTAEIALKRKANSVIIAHNHPQGIAVPSGADMLTTENLILALAPLNIQLSDHIIIAKDQSSSMRDSGHLEACELKVAERFG